MHSNENETAHDGGVEETLRESVAENRSVCLPCPLCFAPVELDATQGLQHATCPACGLVCSLDPTPIVVEELEDEQNEPETSVTVDDLDHWLAGAPIRPRQRSGSERLLLWCRQHAILIGVASIIFAVLTGITLTTTFAYLGVNRTLVEQKNCIHQNQVEREYLSDQLLLAQKNSERIRQETQAKIRKADLQRQQSQRQSREAFSLNLARHAQQLVAANPQRAILLAAESLQVALTAGDRPDLSAYQLLRERIAGFEGRSLHGHRARIASLQISSDGSWLVSGSFDGTARLWDLQNENPETSSLVLTGHRDCVSALAFSPDNRWLATAGSDTTVRLWNLKAPRPAQRPIILTGHVGRIRFLNFSGDGRWLITSSSGLSRQENTTRLWDLAASRPDRTALTLPNEMGLLNEVVVSPDGRWLSTVDPEGVVLVWDLRQPNPTQSPLKLNGKITGTATLAFSGDGRFLAYGSSGFRSQDDLVRVWDLQKDKTAQPRVVGRHEGGIRKVLLSRDARWLVATGEDGTARVWNLSESQPTPVVLTGHVGAIQTAMIDSPGNWLMTGGVDGTVRMWSLGREGPGTTAAVTRTEQGSISVLAISPQAHLLATAGEDHTVRVWNLQIKQLVDLAFTKALRSEKVVERPREESRSLR